MLRHFSGLWRHPDFMKLWMGQTVSAFGSRITRDGLPLIAVIVLAATPAQMGILVAISSLPVALISLLAGVWVDRQRRRPIMIVMDFSRFLLLLLLPIGAVTGHLSMGLLYIVATLAALFSLFFDLAYHSILPSLVSREYVLEGNTKLATTEALAEIGGPALAGILVQLISAPLAIFFDALSFLFSAASLLLIRAPETPSSPRRTEQSLWNEITEGIRVIVDNPLLRIVAGGTGARSFFGNFYAALYGLYVIRDLGLSPAVLGISIAAGGVGSLVGALLAGWLPRRFGPGRSLTGALLVGSLVSLLIPLAGGPALLAAGMIMVAQLINDGAMAVFEINELTLRQTAIPDHLLGRTHASMGFLAQVTGPIGALSGGFLAAVFGARFTLLIAVLGGLAIALWTLCSPLRKLQAYSLFTPDLESGAPEVEG